jgi:hypothetical protein
MPKKSKKKTGKKNSKKAAVKKAVRKKATRKAPSRTGKKKSTGRSSKAPGRKRPVGTTLRTPDICTENFPGKNNDPVEFQNIPQGTTVYLYQTDTNDYYPFTPYETDTNGLRYTEIEAGDVVTITVPAVNQTYPYLVNGDANCPDDDPGHSVTVGN